MSAVEPIVKISEIAMGILSKIEGVIRASQRRLEVAQDGIESPLNIL